MTYKEKNKRLLKMILVWFLFLYSTIITEYLVKIPDYILKWNLLLILPTFISISCEKKPIIVTRILKGYLLFVVGGATYNLIEILFRGYTHWSMTILGGLCFLLIGLINELIKTSITTQMILSSVIITFLEFVTGYIVNIHFGLNIWDYSNLPYNFMGQICLLFFNLWFVLSIIGIILDDFIRFLIYDETIPKYYL